MTGVATCQHCGQMFEVPKQLAGGITNCPGCGKATEVEGLRDPFWRTLQVGAVVLLLGVTMLAYHLGGTLPATITAVIGGGLLWLFSRAF